MLRLFNANMSSTTSPFRVRQGTSIPNLPLLLSKLRSSHTSNSASASNSSTSTSVHQLRTPYQTLREGLTPLYLSFINLELECFMMLFLHQGSGVKISTDLLNIILQQHEVVQEEVFHNNPFFLHHRLGHHDNEVSHDHVNKTKVLYIQQILDSCMQKKVSSSSSSPQDIHHHHHHRHHDDERLDLVCKCFLIIIFPFLDNLCSNTSHSPNNKKNDDDVNNNINNNDGDDDADVIGCNPSTNNKLFKLSLSTDLQDYFSSTMSVCLAKSAVLHMMDDRPPHHAHHHTTKFNMTAAAHDEIETVKNTHDDDDGGDDDTAYHHLKKEEDNDEFVGYDLLSIENVIDELELIENKYAKKESPNVDNKNKHNKILNSIHIKEEEEDVTMNPNPAIDHNSEQSHNSTTAIGDRFHRVFHIENMKEYYSKLQQSAHFIKDQAVKKVSCLIELIQKLEVVKPRVMMSTDDDDEVEEDEVEEDDMTNGVAIRSQELYSDSSKHDLLDNPKALTASNVTGIKTSASSSPAVASSSSLSPGRHSSPPKVLLSDSKQSNLKQAHTASGLRLLGTKLLKLCCCSSSSSLLVTVKKEPSKGTTSTMASTATLTSDTSPEHGESKVGMSVEESKVLRAMKRLLLFGAPVATYELGSLKSPLHLVIRNFEGVLRLVKYLS
jgi:hypothetical protein